MIPHHPFNFMVTEMFRFKNFFQHLLPISIISRQDKTNQFVTKQTKTDPSVILTLSMTSFIKILSTNNIDWNTFVSGF